jgi:hypothetical protein
MRSRKELKEHCRVYRQVSAEHSMSSESREANRLDSPSNTETPQPIENTNTGKCRSPSTDQTKDRSDTKSHVESPSPTDQVTSESPKGST